MRNLDFSTKVFRLLMLVLLLFSVQISRADEGWPRTLKGRIVDAKSGETLIGVNIQILGTTTGTISDFDGGFQLVVKANSVIQFSYVGYKPIEIKAEEAVKKTVLPCAPALRATRKRAIPFIRPHGANCSGTASPVKATPHGR